MAFFLFSMKNRLVGMAYIVITFFLIPFLLIMISGGSRSAIVDYKFANKNLVTGLTTYTVIEDQIDGDNGNIKRKIYSNLDKPDYSTDQKATFEKSVNKNDKTLFIRSNNYKIDYKIESKDIQTDTASQDGNLKMPYNRISLVLESINIESTAKD